MGCGCSKRKKKVEEPVESVAPSAVAYSSVQSDEIVQARCTNCVGLLRTSDGKYLPMHTGEYYPVLLSDTKRWISQGWVIGVKK